MSARATEIVTTIWIENPTLFEPPWADTAEFVNEIEGEPGVIAIPPNDAPHANGLHDPPEGVPRLEGVATTRRCATGRCTNSRRLTQAG